jgi:hypothetical protein
MISNEHFVFATILVIVAGIISFIPSLRFLFTYAKNKKDFDNLFIGLFLLSLAWLLVSFFIRALLPAHALSLTIIGLVGFGVMFPFGGASALSLTGIKNWKIFAFIIFLFSFFSLGLFTGDVLARKETIEGVLWIGKGLYVFPSIRTIQLLVMVIILLVSGFFFYLIKISSGFLRKKGLTLAIGSLLLLFLLPDLLGYGMDFLGIWRIGEVTSCITLFYGWMPK